jgi:hypothetical protein
MEFIDRFKGRITHIGKSGLIYSDDTPIDKKSYY